MSKQASVGGADRIAIPYHCIRNISGPEDLERGRKIYAGHMSTGDAVSLPTEENVRGYLVEAEGKKSRRMTAVHRAILETLKNHTEDFSILNGGMVIVARKCDVDDKRKTMTLTDPSIVNGAQTQGVLKHYFKEYGRDAEVPHITFELLVSDDEDLIGEVSIARNYQNDVASISMAGRRNQLDELEKAVNRGGENRKLRKKESQFPGDEYLNTEKLLQVLWVLTPPRLLGKEESYCQVHAYNQKEKCIQGFMRVHASAHDATHQDHGESYAIYSYFIDIAGDAWDLYHRWKSHQGFKGSGLRSILRDGREIVEVPDGIVFPILSSLAIFASKGGGGRWKINPPPIFDDRRIIQAAKAAYQESAFSKPHIMGKSKACYTRLRDITSLYQSLAE